MATKTLKKIDKVRASRDGHEYHEAWTARKAIQLLRPDSELAAIAVEGLSPSDQAGASSQTVEIADLTFYFGSGHTIETASRTTISQLKYSIADKDKDFRVTKAKKPIEKFCKAYCDFKRAYGAQTVEEKLDFQLITNQPISASFIRAIDALASSSPRKGDIKNQAIQFQNASGLTGKPLAAFARKFKLIGRTGSLPETKNHLESLLVDWSATNDPIASARLGKLRALVRDKAGYAGTHKSLITRTDILAALQIGDPKDLLPCESALADVGKILERDQLTEALSQIASTASPLLVHAAGGVGKTVFMNSLTTKIANDYEVVFFDCFGGGDYRSPADARHLPKRGLIHLANTLAFRGLCDPMLPDNPDLQSLLKTFRRRLIQSVETIARMTPGRKLALFIDAIDNADLAACQSKEDCFPIKLLECLDTEPAPGVKLIVSCRTERIPQTYGKYEEFQLRPFSKEETASFLRARLRDVSSVEINVAQARSGGNPRVLEYLLKAGRGLLDESEIEKKLELDDLIQQRITAALDTSMKYGYKEEDIKAFLAGLAVLPPPVPLEEYAEAHGIEISAIESFASDLNPLLERTNQGLLFRDEPTETLVHRRYASSKKTLRRIAKNLNARQDISVYAARALPGLLHALDEGKKLLALAFDDRIPTSITSTVGKRNIKYARLRVATLHAALNKNYNSLVQLLLELSTIAAVDQRGARYISDYPDLVVAAQDVDATRRLFEVRTDWPGTRHARLTIANILSGDLEEANRHAHAAKEWIVHYHRSRSDNGPREIGPAHPDIAAIPFFLISGGHGKDAARYLEGWQEWYVYEVCEFIFDFSHLAQDIRSEPKRRLGCFINELSGVGALSATLSFQELSAKKQKELIVKLAKCCRNNTKLDLPHTWHRERPHEIQDGLRKSATIALSLGLLTEAMAISLRTPHERPSLWALRDSSYGPDVFGYLFQVALQASAKKQAIHERDVLPKELIFICARISKQNTGEEFIKKAKVKISKNVRKQKKDGGEENPSKALSYDESQNAERFLSQRLEPLLALTKALSGVLGAQPRGIDKAFLEFVDTWEDSSKIHNPYQIDRSDNVLNLLGLDIALFCLWASPGLRLASVKHFLTKARSQGVGAENLVRIVALLAQRKPLHALAGEQAFKARSLIEKDDDVNSRASLFGALARAILPVNTKEAAVYFREGLEQMDAIGSGDYGFTNELLLFAAQLKGDELGEREFHTLSNICELNMGYEPEKFFWGAYGFGLSKTSGLKGLAKLSRWDDRSKIELNNTLLPYLIGLLKYEKIDAKDALALNRLANPVEYYSSSTKEFAEALHQQAGPVPVVFKELISQLQDDNPEMAGNDTIKTLSMLAEEALGRSSEITKFLVHAHKNYSAVRDTQNERLNSPSEFDKRVHQRTKNQDRDNQMKLKQIAAATTPADEVSLVKAIDGFNALKNKHDLKGDFFGALRSKVSYAKQEQYIRNIAKLENLFYYWKLEELKEAKQAWGRSSASLECVFKSLAVPLIGAHTDDLIDQDRLSGYEIKKISEITGVPTAELVLELIKIFARPDREISGTVWLAFASLICPDADAGQGQLALKRLLSSKTSRLADNVIDGTWVNGLYPKSEFCEVASGIIWRILGSACATNRWHGAHCIRSFARFGRWDIIDKLVSLIDKVDAGPFQATELPFFYLHARLWLLITLARLALDYPTEISFYKDELLCIALEDNAPHVLLRHFAARALISCVDAKRLKLPAMQIKRLRNADLSPHNRLRKKIRKGGGFYHGRPESEPKPSIEFCLDYDFHKQDVDNLSLVFGQQCWKVADLMSEIVHGIDPSVKSMYESQGRDSQNQRNLNGISTLYHTHGQQLGYHSLLLAAGKLLKTYPVTNDWWNDADPWDEWLNRYLLTRQDGLWLSDGTDRTPTDTGGFLLEQQNNNLAIIEKREKILSLAGLSARVDKEVVIAGEWQSADNVTVHISSSLVPTEKAATLAKKLTREEPINVWVPCFDENEYNSDFLHGNKKEYTPWVVYPSYDTRFDEHDPYGVPCANLRPYLSFICSKFCSLSKEDPFGRIWKDKHGRVALRAQAWGRNDRYIENGPSPSTRLFCDASTLKRVLKKFDKDLLILINLKRYEKESYRSESKTTNTVAVARIKKNLKIEYFKGRVNYLYKPKY